MDKNDAFLGKEEIITDILAQIDEAALAEAQLDEFTVIETSDQTPLGEPVQEYTRWKDQMDKWGYTWEAFEVTTEDDYILTTFRITGKVGETAFSPTKGAVLIQHGYTMDAANWISDYTTKPMPLILADNGYDVWMGNNRGTEYSRGNRKGLNISQKEFWAWDWGEMGIYDDPAIINFIKK